MRMITDARPANQRLPPPPRVDLLTAEGSSRLEVVVNDDPCLLEDASWGIIRALRLCLGVGDVENCFHRMVMPPWMSPLFAFPALSVSELRVDEVDTVEGRVASGDDLVYPCCRALPMGCSWSLHFCQNANANLARQCDLLREARLATDRGEPVVFRLGGPREQEDLWHYVYVDNLGVLGQDADAARSALDEKVATFNKLRRDIHEVELFEAKGQALGAVVDCERLCTSIADKRRWRLERALAYALRQGKPSGRDLECLLGNCTYAGLVRREVLSVFSACYAFVQACYWGRREMWASVRDELSCFRGLLVFLSSDWVLPWNRRVTASDAS